MRSGAQLPNNELQGNLSSIACSTSSLADIGICRVVSLTFFSLVTIKMLNFGGYRDRKQIVLMSDLHLSQYDLT